MTLMSFFALFRGFFGWVKDQPSLRMKPLPKLPPNPHGLRLIIKEDVLPISDYPKFEAIAEVAKRGLLAPETRHCNRPYINLKLGTVIEQNGDGCLEDSLMPVGWPLQLKMFPPHHNPA